MSMASLSNPHPQLYEAESGSIKELHAVKSHVGNSTPSSDMRCLTDAGQQSKFEYSNLRLLPVPSCPFCAANLNCHVLKGSVLMKG